MANTLIISALNPIHYVEANPTEVAAYASRHFENYHFEDTILDWEQPTTFRQIWQTSDTIRQQIKSNYAPLTLKVWNEYGVVLTENFTQVLPSYDDPTLFVYEHSLDLSILEEGCYYLTLDCGLDVDGNPVLTLISNTLEIRNAHANSLLLEYTNYQSKEEVIFETGYAPSLRVPGVLRFDGPASKRTVYEDQVLNTTTLEAKKYRLFKLHIGLERGIPDYLIDKIESILGCSSLSIDGKYYAVPEGGKLEPNAEENYPMRGWTVDLRERYTRGGVTYENEEPLSSRRSVVILVNSKGFGNDTGGSVSSITDIE